LAKHAKSFWPEGSLKSASFGRIVSDTHYSRLSSILQNTHAQVVFGGGKDFEGTIDPSKRKYGLELTIFELDKEHWDNDALMNECVALSDVEAPHSFRTSFIESCSVLFCPFYQSTTSTKPFALSTAGELFLLQSIYQHIDWIKGPSIGPVFIHPERRNQE
jgi:hypothetical protein